MGNRFTLIGSAPNADPLTARLAPAVGWLFSADYDKQATCFLVHEWWIATAGHVMMTPEDAGDFVAVFDYLADTAPGSRDAWATDPQDRGFFTAYPELDVSFVRLRRRENSPSPLSRRRGMVPLGSAVLAVADRKAILVHHPDATRFKAVSAGKIGPVGVTGRMVHAATAGDGSSGAPLFDEDGGWIGIHKGDEELSVGGLWVATSAAHIIAAMRAPEMQRLLPRDLAEAISAGRD